LGKILGLGGQAPWPLNESAPDCKSDKRKGYIE